MEQHNNEIFEMVNNHERQKNIHRKYSEKRKRNNLRILNMSIISALISLFFGIVGLTGAMNIYIAAPILAFFGMLAAFMVGRWFENGKCLGWE